MWWRKKTKKQPIEIKFRIEHYPITGFYMVKYKNVGWLKLDHTTGLMKANDFFDVCDKYKSLNECYRAIELFQQHRLKVGVKYIDVE